MFVYWIRKFCRTSIESLRSTWSVVKLGVYQGSCGQKKGSTFLVILGRILVYNLWVYWSLWLWLYSYCSLCVSLKIGSTRLLFGDRKQIFCIVSLWTSISQDWCYCGPFIVGSNLIANPPLGVSTFNHETKYSTFNRTVYIN